MIENTDLQVHVFISFQKYNRYNKESREREMK
jgi:hypothetical protein